MTNKDWQSTFLSNYHGKTLVSYRHTLTSFLVDQSVEEVTSVNVREWLDELDCQLSTKHKHLNCLRAFFRWLVEQEDSPIARSPIGREFKLPKSRDALHERILSPTEVGDLLYALQHDVKRKKVNCDRNYLFFKLIYVLGLRISEAINLKWRDFSRDGGQVSIYGKGGKTRVLAVPTGVWDELSKWGKDKKGLVFATETGLRILPNDLHDIIKSAALSAGLEGAEYVSAHWLRHSHATHALNGGAPIHLVQKSLGHSNLETTGRYLHVTGGESSSNYLGLKE